MAQSTFIQQYGPLFAALIALSGVFMTLRVNGKRETARDQMAREDDYRKEQRQVIAAVVVAAHTYRREAGALGDPETLLSLGYERATALKDSAEHAMSELLNQLTVAKLLVHSHKLQEAIDGLFNQWNKTSDHTHAVVDAFWAEDPENTRKEAGKLRGSWQSFGVAAATIHTVALNELRPTIVT